MQNLRILASVLVAGSIAFAGCSDSGDGGTFRVRNESDFAITEIRVTKSGPQRFLTVVVEDPRKFIDRGGSLRRKVYEANYRKAGTPVNVTARTLAIPFEDLIAKTSEFYRRYGRQ